VVLKNGGGLGKFIAASSCGGRRGGNISGE
jgi:hypothetical protein